MEEAKSKIKTQTMCLFLRIKKNSTLFLTVPIKYHTIELAQNKNEC